MRVRVGCEFQFQSQHPVTTVMLVGTRADGAHRTIYESRWVDPVLPVRDFRDAFANSCWRIEFPQGIEHGALRRGGGRRRRARSLATRTRCSSPPADLPDEVLGFTLPSRYVESDQVANEAWELFGDTPPTWERVQAVCDWVHANITYDPTAVVQHGTARRLLERRAGVCRDFALLVTAFCRALNIPARYTFGYLPDIAVEPPDTPMDFHAWTRGVHRRPLVHLRRAAQHAARRARRGRLRPRRRGRRDDDVVRRAEPPADDGVGGGGAAATTEEPRPKLAPLEPALPAHMTHAQLLGGGVR